MNPSGGGIWNVNVSPPWYFMSKREASLLSNEQEIPVTDNHHFVLSVMTDDCRVMKFAQRNQCGTLHCGNMRK